MDRYARSSPGSAGKLQGRTPNKQPDELASSFNRLSIATKNVAAAPSSSPSPSPYQSPSRSFDRNSRHDSPSRAFANHPAPRKTPSTSSLREERRGSVPSLQKRASVSSLRSVQNYSSSGVAPPRTLSRRSSSNLLSATAAGMAPKSPLMGPDSPAPLPPPTASSIAQEHFKSEMALHQSGDLQSKTVVVIQDLCYGHRFSRPRTSKAGLEQIVERPERLLASVLGVSAAYVRMGRRYEDGPFSPHPDLDLRTLPVPPFQVRKTTRTMPLNSPAVTHVHGSKWMDELKVMCDAAESRLAMNGKELVRPSSSGKDANSNTPPRLHEGDLYLCAESLTAFEGALGGVCEAVDSVFVPGAISRAFVAIRPPGHHCSSDYPSGFCWLNNVHVGIAHAAMSHGLTHAAIIDFDLHHGDGSQDIAWEQNRKAKGAAKNAPHYKKTSVGYFSLHDINSYPCEAGDATKVRNASVCIDNAHGQSIWNVHLEPWKTPSDFWELYNTKYSILIEKARMFLRSHTQRLANTPNSPPPKAAIFISAGFDASEWEGIGMQRHKVNVPTDFYARFTTDIVRLAEEEGLGVDGRVISVLEGGYTDRALMSGVLSHLSALSDCSSEEDDHHSNRLASEMFGRLGLSDVPEKTPGEENRATFDTEWWKPHFLEELELLARAPPPPPARKQREKGPPTYSSPTQASVAKIVVAPRDRRSLSSQFSAIDGGYLSPPHLPVDWATAAFELSKVLIPTDRRTVSCQHAELKVESARTRRDRHSISSTSNSSELQIVGDQKRMQLRERKPKAPSPEFQTPRQSSRATRRTTIASISDLPDPSEVEPPEVTNENFKHPASRTSRRVSVTSTAASNAGLGPGGVPSSPSSNASSGRVLPSRPESSNGASGDSLNVKKYRAASTNRTTTAGLRSSPRKAAATSQNASSRPVPGRSMSAAPIPPSRSSSINTDTDRDVNSLSAGIKKLSIKLKVPSPEEHAAREEERRKVISAKASRRPQSSKSNKSSIMQPSGRVSRPGTSSGQPIDSSDPIKQETPLPAPAIGGDLEPMPPQLTSPPLSANSSGGAAGWPSESVRRAMETFEEPSKNMIPGIKEEPSTSHMSPPLTPQSLDSSGHPRIMVKPPTSAYHNTAKLPVFTSTSAIPFASPERSSSAPGSR
ncbi:hypothetical protein FQN50_001959 [Emmonsiellopsis sp. PD_5]|nr:hypothetical protein FQN50_001959 [Emmonsiellopsis sp. PD_5]